MLTKQIATEIREAAFKALGQWEENKQKDQEWWYDELKTLKVEKENGYVTEQRAEYKEKNKELRNNNPRKDKKKKSVKK